MTDNNHLITPPTDLVIDWRLDPGYIERTEKVTMVTMTTGRLQYIATQAARWGADQELEACCAWLDEVGPSAIPLWGNDLRKDRRPNPKNLAAEALAELELTADPNGAELSRTQVELIRCALKALSD